MVAQNKITSGFDVEFLMGEEYIKYFLLSSMETRVPFRGFRKPRSKTPKATTFAQTPRLLIRLRS